MNSVLARISLVAVLAIAPGIASVAFAQQPQPAPSGQGQTATKPPKSTEKPALKAGEYASESEAKGRCSGDNVVWSNFNTKVYHYAGNADYGKTKKGAYMCEKGAQGARFRAAKNEKKPS